ncbi:MAG TPA: SRPBCC domain-containing protein, partial [Actinomycetota bacterium]|nr:SRPBCC domain-containing protein [Actinomycetota bacterium]
RLPAPPREVWWALTSPERLAAWFGAEVAIEPRAGGPVEVRWADGTRARGVVEEALEPRRLVLRWRRLSGAGLAMAVGPATRIAFELRPRVDGTDLAVEEVPVELVSAPGGWGA